MEQFGPWANMTAVAALISLFAYGLVKVLPRMSDNQKAMNTEWSGTVKELGHSHEAAVKEVKAGYQQALDEQRQQNADHVDRIMSYLEKQKPNGSGK